MRPTTVLSAAVLHAALCWSAEPVTFLKLQPGLGSKQVESLTRGPATAHMLPATSSSEVAVVGVVRIPASVSDFLARFRDIRAFKQSAEVVSIGLLEDLPVRQRQRLMADAHRFQIGSAVREIAETATYLQEYAPPLMEVLQGRPAPAGLEQFIYWSRERVFRTLVFTATEVSIYRDPSGSRAFILTRQIYADRYYQASLGVTALFETPRGTWVAYVNRSRSPFFAGPFSGLRRSFAGAVITSTVERKLQETKSRFEPFALAR